MAETFETCDMAKTRSGKKRKEAEMAETSETSDMAEMEEEAPIALVPSEPKRTKRNDADSDASFVGNPFSQLEAAQKWPTRYQSKVTFFLFPIVYFP